ncbi:restriction endonuclease, SacI family [Bernardetia sp. ABR2-2B]|uniref:restriction endonuclease, SacI family n=1 Tax=Bernardetia sp. ABR2-2B TaxID=3127472 RepID=UPI0030CE5526
MNHKDKLKEIYTLSSSLLDIKNVDAKTQDYIQSISKNIKSQKGVFTVLVTLLTHKLIEPKQDIRYHQSGMKDGFSGRSIDTQFITPTLKELGLPSMAESGWLTRSLEQPYPYTLNYNGKISNKKVKEAFLNILDVIEKKPNTARNILRLLLSKAIQIQKDSIVKITPLKDVEKVSIDKIYKALDEHFYFKYKIAGGSKLPVLALFAVYQNVVFEMSRYSDCALSPLGSHTASDRTSKTAGDIEIFKKKQLFEAVEVKLDKPIDANMVRIAIEKIKRYNPNRYYILSYEIKQEENHIIEGLVAKMKVEHGCQIIVNGILPTIKYYLRLISSLSDFVENYSLLVQNDTELKKIHKEKWNQLIKKYLN